MATPKVKIDEAALRKMVQPKLDKLVQDVVGDLTRRLGRHPTPEEQAAEVKRRTK